MSVLFGSKESGWKGKRGKGRGQRTRKKKKRRKFYNYWFFYLLVLSFVNTEFQEEPDLKFVLISSSLSFLLKLYCICKVKMESRKLGFACTDYLCNRLCNYILYSHIISTIQENFELCILWIALWIEICEYSMKLDCIKIIYEYFDNMKSVSCLRHENFQPAGFFF